MKKTYYKVVKYNLKSAIIDNSADIEYKINKWVYAPCRMRLFVFDNLNSAKSFRRSLCFWSKHRIFECEVKNPTSKYRLVINCCNVTKVFIDTINNILCKQKKSIKLLSDLIPDITKYNNMWPTGTKFVTAVKLIREIE